MKNIKAWTLLGALALLGAETASISAADAELRVRCERRAGKRSRVSVDGTNVVPGSYQITLKSGSATAPSVTEVVPVGADEFEADYDSSRADIRAGATAIGAKFIQNGKVNVAVSGPVSFDAKDYACVVR
jgi:hypothetical protein